MSKVSFKAGIVALLLSAASANAATIQNGSFEDIGDTKLNRSGWSFFTSIPGWTGMPTGEIQSDRTLRQIDAQDGEYYAELDSNQNSGIFQDIFFDTGSYLLSFFYSPRVNDASQGTNDMTFSVGSLFSGSVNGAPNPAFPRGEWTEITGIFDVLVPDTYRITFAAAGAENERNGCGDCGALIDNISITGMSDPINNIAPIPLPAPALLLLAGLGGLGLLRARRTAR